MTIADGGSGLPADDREDDDDDDEEVDARRPLPRLRLREPRNGCCT
jgi:hypothetical protein